MPNTKFKTSTVVLTDADFDKERKVYVKKDVKLNYYDFKGIEFKLYERPEKNRIGELYIEGVDKFVLRENEGEYGKYWSGTIDKGQLYFNVKKGLARRGESAPITITFREAINLTETNTEGDDDDLPF